MDIIFDTERLIVRAMTRDDYDNFFLLHGNAEVMRYIRPVHTREESDARLNDWFAQPYTQPFLGRWAVLEKETNTFIGSFIMAPIPTTPERIQLGYSFLPEYWGQGYGTEVTKAGLDYFRYRTTLQEIYAVIEEPNIGSHKVLLKAGFQEHERKTEDGKELIIFIVKR
jgi:ribosomal-protein-alanine N-acetyltransferase